MPIAEPSCDVRAQIAALVDIKHPKKAVFLVPENRLDIPVDTDGVVERYDRLEGTLLTNDPVRIELFKARVDDVAMAWILGYPQDKAAVVKACNGDPLRAIAVQARTPDGAIVTEVFVSPARVEGAKEHLAAHGMIVTLTATEAIARRLSLRMGHGNG